MMGKAQLFIFVALAAVLGHTQSYVSDSRPSNGGGWGGSHGSGGWGGSRGGGGWGDNHGVVSKRAEVVLPEPVENLVNKIKDLISDYRNGVATIKTMEQSFQEIATEAKDILDRTSIKVTKQDVLSFAGDVAGSFITMLISHSDDSTTLEFAVNLLNKIVERIYEEPTKMFIAVTAIEETAKSITHVLTGIRELFETPFGKRQTQIGADINHGPQGTSGSIYGSHTSGGLTVGGHVDHSPYGTSGGASGSYTTSGGTTYGGHVDKGPFGTNSGVSVSHTWDHPGGSSTTIGGNYGHSSYGGPSVGIGISHSWKRLASAAALKKRQSTIGGNINHGPGGTSYGVHGSHTWNHSGGSSTTVGGSVNHSPGGTSGGVSVTHTFGRRNRA